MRVARISTVTGAQYALARPNTQGIDEWAVVENPFDVPLIFTGESVPEAGTLLLAPSTPQVVVGIAHNKGNNDHSLPIQAWHKSVRAIAGPHERVVIRSDIGAVNIEGELAIVIGRRAYQLTLENALDAVFGYTIGNDVTNIDQVAEDEKLFQVKSGINYAPIGPWIETEIDDPDNMTIDVAINGVMVAQSNTRNLSSTIVQCLVYVTSWLELGPGDVIFTGSPQTFSRAHVGDVVDVTIPSVGTLTVTINGENTHD